MPLMPTPPMPTKWTRAPAPPWAMSSPVCCMWWRRAGVMRGVRGKGRKTTTGWRGSCRLLQDDPGHRLGGVRARQRAGSLRHRQQQRAVGEDFKGRRQALRELVVLRQQLRGAAVDQELRVLGLVVVDRLRERHQDAAHPYGAQLGQG